MVDEALILRYFTGEITAEERSNVEKWISESEQNRKLAKDIYYLYFAVDTLYTMKSVDSMQALKNVKKRAEKRKTGTIFTWIQRVAAILFIPLLLSTVFSKLKKEPIEYMEIRTTPGMVASVNLPDGSVVWLNSDSYLRHPVKFTGKTREVNLIGEAYFKVNRNEKLPFFVNTKENLRVEVLGTEFNVDAYDDNQYVSTTLLSGSVKLNYKGSNNQEKNIVMQPGQKIYYDELSKTIAVSQPFLPSEVAWKEGKIILRNTSLEETLKMLSKRFNVSFVLKNKALKDNYFTGTFDKQQLPRILEHLRISSNIRYRIIDPKSGDEGLKERSKVELY
ncbi:FecR family protein [Macellibacteroides fermentans]|uniref:FecR family protein n=1 Tax=Macellibacteroides fermentans TaxID=879969 RepID=UPI00406BEB3E